MLRVLHRIEYLFGRERVSRWGARPLDLDLIGTGRRVLPDAATSLKWMALDPEVQRRSAPETLILPHPRMHERAFVLIPLAEVAPGWRHPVLGRTVAEMAAALPADPALRRLG